MVGLRRRMTAVHFKWRNTSGGHWTENNSHEIQMEYDSDEMAMMRLTTTVVSLKRVGSST